MCHTFEVIVYTYNISRLLSNNSSEDVELPVRVKNLRCSCGFMLKMVDKKLLGLNIMQLLASSFASLRYNKHKSRSLQNTL